MNEPFRTVRVLLQQVLAMHQSQFGHLVKKTARCNDPTLRALTAYLEKQESELARLLGRYEKQGDPNVLATQIQSPPDAALTRAVTEDRLARRADDPAALGDHIMQRDAALVDFYRQLSASLTAPDVRELFASLAELVKRDRMRLSTALASDDPYFALGHDG